MTALTGNRNLDYDPRGRNVYDLASAQQVWAGGLVGLNAAGFLIDWDNAAATQFVGVCAENAFEGPTTQDVAPIHDGGGILKHIPVASAVQSSVGLEIFCTTDNVLTDCVLAAGAVSRGFGRIIRFRSNTNCDIEIYSAAEWSAGRGQLDSIASITDNTTGAGTDTLAIGVGIYEIAFPYLLKDIADGDLITNLIIGHKFKIISLKWVTTFAATTGSKDSDITVEIGATTVTGIAIALDSDDSTTDTLGVVTTSDADAANTGSATATVSIIAASTVAFTEGSGVFLLEVQNMDAADAFASLRDKIQEILAI